MRKCFAKLKDGNPGYDLIFPSDYMVEIMAGLGLLMPVDHSKVPNLKHIDPDPNFRAPPITRPEIRPRPISGAPWGSATANR